MENEPAGRTAREAFEHFLSACYSVAVYLGIHPDLDAPALVFQPGGYMVLEYGMDMPKPIPDLEISDDGIRATLSFSNEPVKTFVPWGSILGMKGIGERPKQRAQLRAV